MNEVYLDSAYLAKCYVNEPDSAEVRRVVWQAGKRCSSAWCLAEVACVFHRHVREGALPEARAAALSKLFLEDIAAAMWLLLPVSDHLMRRVEAAVRQVPATVILRAGDAVHLVSARDAGFQEIWTNDRHLLRAAPHFGMAGRSVSSPGPVRRSSPP